MAGAKGRSRGWSSLNAQTPQAAELASFLRNVMDMHSVTVRTLAGLMHRGKSTISDNLDGRVPSRQFVVDLVTAVVKEPRKRELDLKRALALWDAADKPSYRLPPPRSRRAGSWRSAKPRRS